VNLVYNFSDIMKQKRSEAFLPFVLGESAMAEEKEEEAQPINFFCCRGQFTREKAYEIFSVKKLL